MTPAVLARRLVELLLTLIGISVLAFAAFKLMPGDAALVACNPKAHECGPAALAAERHRLGLDRSLAYQYWAFIRSWLELKPAGWDIAWPAFRNTLSLLVGALVIEIVAGVALGVSAVLRRHEWPDRLVGVTPAIVIAPPAFFVATIFLYLFTIPNGLVRRVDFSGFFSIDVAPPAFPATLEPSYWFGHLMLPSIAVAAAGIGITALVTRSELLRVLGEDYILATRARGVSERDVVTRHALKAAAPTILTTVLADLGRLLIADVLVEVVWSWPGIGAVGIEAVGARNGPLLVAISMLVTFAIACTSMAVDVVQSVLDPRLARER